ncbi:MAG: PorV/PorQ family protein, partial [Bacteroidetes bacterium]|nr:PorV/PorQ family protein [Bacteroidota bacterium]
MKILTFRSLILLALLMLAAHGSFIHNSNAQTGAAAVVFLMIEPDSRAAGMGNAGVALADNANALFWNPAGLADQVGTEVALTHSNWLPELTSDLFFEYLVAKHHIKNWGTVGAHITFLNLGEHEHRDELNNPLGTFRSYDLSVGVSYGFKLTNRLSLGTGIRWIRSNLANVSVGAQETEPGVSIGVDVAALYIFPAFYFVTMTGQYNIGFNLSNMGP